MSYAYVDLPDPGGPITRILGGLLGALDLNFNPTIFFISDVISAGVLSSAGCSNTNWLNAYFTPFMWFSYSQYSCSARPFNLSPYREVSISTSLVLILAIDASFDYLSNITLSGKIPNF